MPSKENQQALVALVGASQDDAERLRPAFESLARLGVPCTGHIASAAWGLRELADWAGQLEERGICAVIASPHSEPALPSVLAAACRLPVLCIESSDGAPRAGTSAAHALATDADSAALFALRILAAADHRWRAAIDAHRSRRLSEGTQQGNALRSQWTGESPAERAQSLDELFPSEPNEPAMVYDLTPGSAEPVVRTAPELLRPLPAGTKPRSAPIEEDDLPARPAARKLGRIVLDPESPNPEAIDDIVDCLLEGGVIAFPTETVYGLAADATNPAAVERLFALKGRDRGKAISLMVDSGKLLGAIAQNVTIEARRLMEAFWPGPLTLIFQKRPAGFRHVSPGDTIGVRLPDHSVPLAILQALARPLACTSANFSGEPDARAANAVHQLFGDRIDALLDAGALPERAASTVLDVSVEPYRILRHGAITGEQIAAVVGDKLEPQG